MSLDAVGLSQDKVEGFMLMFRVLVTVAQVRRFAVAVFFFYS